MGVTTKLALYAVGLVVVFVAAFGVGTRVGPVLPDQPGGHTPSVESPAPAEQDHGTTERDHVDDGVDHQPPGAAHE
ncbi:hypothetical protein [Nocardiopsis sp. SBT366]|uniref:hypothetical protein n=1 Tax=Nocardiopsis sp. SBT366 TaxID=1580529 RepID=UPI00066A5019|nr:hypothetical protein [Nocardiopsis sp. SBT366]